jgi:hypothetical protein
VSPVLLRVMLWSLWSDATGCQLSVGVDTCAQVLQRVLDNHSIVSRQGGVHIGFGVRHVCGPHWQCKPGCCYQGAILCCAGPCSMLLVVFAHSAAAARQVACLMMVTRSLMDRAEDQVTD